MAMNNRVLSIEIGNSFTKICEIDYKVKKPKVYKVLTVETPEGVVVDGMLQPTQEYADHLVNALGTNGIRTRKVIFTISSTRVASREVQIPNVKANKIEALVKTNANDYFPVDLTQYEIGHYLAGGLTEEGKLRVMALAVPKALLDSYYQLAQMCGWEVECFDYSSNSLYQILRDEKSEKVTMMIKIDENSTIVTVLSAGKVLLQRTVAYGVQDAIETMIASGAYAVNDPMSAVERFQKKTCLNRVLHQGDKLWEENAGRWEDEDAGNVEVTTARQKITSSLEPLIVGVSRVIDFYDSRNSDNPIQKTFVTGLGGSFSGMSKLFTNCLERKVHTLSEMDDKIGMSKAIRSTRPAAYISCLGAVLAPVGLIDKSTQKAKGLTVVSGTNYTFVSVAVLVLGVILSIAMAVTSLTRYFGTVAENVALQARVEELQPAQTVYNEYLSTAAQYDKYKYLYEYTENPNENLVEFINELEQILPSSFWTNSFSSDMEGISMSVTVEGKAAAARTILNIRNMESIEDVQISNITDTQNELGESAVTFSITGTYADIHADTEETESTGDTTGTTAQ
jgi:type IV pilus assembly protein PilN